MFVVIVNAHVKPDQVEEKRLRLIMHKVFKNQVLLALIFTNEQMIPRFSP
jgi:hypothetical protein